MEEVVRKELDTIRGMVRTWKESYLQWLTDDDEGDVEFILKEFVAEIESYVYPYVRRLFECQYITEQEAREVLNFCYDQVKDLHKLLTEEG
jgi:hypothetical protein